MIAPSVVAALGQYITQRRGVWLAGEMKWAHTPHHTHAGPDMLARIEGRWSALWIVHAMAGGASRETRQSIAAWNRVRDHMPAVIVYWDPGLDHQWWCECGIAEMPETWSLRNDAQPWPVFWHGLREA